MENPIKIDDLGGTIIFGNPQIFQTKCFNKMFDWKPPSIHLAHSQLQSTTGRKYSSTVAGGSYMHGITTRPFWSTR